MENCSLRPAQANSSQDSISKITIEKWAGGVTQVIENLLCKHKAPSSNPSPIPLPKKKELKVK
jgi:hypothetical protein